MPLRPQSERPRSFVESVHTTVTELEAGVQKDEKASPAFEYYESLEAELEPTPRRCSHNIGLEVS